MITLKELKQHPLLDDEEYAREAQEKAGNWKKFRDFCWHRQSDEPHPEQWAIFYTHHRDSGLLAQSNADVYQRLLQRFTQGAARTVVLEHHTHWAVGWVDGFSIRVYTAAGKVTRAFQIYCELQAREHDYPILDEDDYGRRQYEATLANVTDAAWRLKNNWELPEGWEYDVYNWLSDTTAEELDDSDDQGGYPSEEGLAAAFVALNYKVQTHGEEQTCS